MTDHPATGGTPDATTADDRTHSLSATAGEGWVHLPLDPAVDAQAWALDVLVLLASDLPDERAARLDARVVAGCAGHLAEIVALARDTRDPAVGAGVDLALAHVVAPDVPALAWADVTCVREAGRVTALEAAFGEEVDATAGPDVVRVERTEVDLPPGPGTRLRSTVVPARTGPDRPAWGEGVDVLLRPTRFSDVRVLLRSRWTRIAHGEELADAVDALTRTVGLEVCG